MFVYNQSSDKLRLKGSQPDSILDCDVTMTSFNSFNIYRPLIFSKDSLLNYLHGLPVILTVVQERWCHGAMEMCTAPWSNPNLTGFWSWESWPPTSPVSETLTLHITPSLSTVILTVPCLDHIAWWNISQIHWICRGKTTCTKICTF